MTAMEPETADEEAARTEREAEVAALMARLEDPNDPYDAHHGNDRSPESIEYAREHDPALAARLERKVELGAPE